MDLKIERMIPGLKALRSYRWSVLPGDLSAGFTVAVMIVPQGMAYALLAGMPPVAGIYASTVPLFLYALFGSSRQLAVGPVAIISLLTLTGVSSVAAPGSAEFAQAAALLAGMVGIIQLLFGVLGIGFLSGFVSHAVISGFTSAAAIVIGLSQLGSLFGLSGVSSRSGIELFLELFARVPELHPVTASVGMGSVAVLLVLRRLLPRIPASLVVVILGGTAAYLLALEGRGVAVVGEVAGGLPSLRPPWPSGLNVVPVLLPVALAISLVGFMESYAVGKSIASMEKYRINANQEFRGLGMANLGAALFSAFPVTGGFSRSAVNHQAGARTALAGVFTAVLVAASLLFLTPLFHHLPQAVLAAVVVVAVSGLVDLGEPKRLFRIKKVDGFTLLVTFFSTLLIGIEPGIIMGVAFSLVLFLWRSAYPHWARMGYLREVDVFRNVDRFSQAEEFVGTIVLRIDASLYFANIERVEEVIRGAVHENRPVRRVILDFSGVNDFDAEAVLVLERLFTELKREGSAVHVASMKEPVRDLTSKARWPERFGSSVLHVSVESALASLGFSTEKAPGAVSVGRNERIWIGG